MGANQGKPTALEIQGCYQKKKLKPEKGEKSILIINRNSLSFFFEISIRNVQRLLA